MSSHRHPLIRFAAELRRRHVVRVAVGYTLVGGGVWGAADVAFPALGLPDLAMTVLVVFVILGLPLALVLAWALDVTPEGIRVTPPVPSPSGPLGAAATAGATAVPRDPILPTPVAGADPVAAPHLPTSVESASPTPSDSIAVLPLMNMSSEEEDEYFSDGMTEELINVLAQVPGLRVAARTSSFAFKGKHEDVREIGEKLSVGTVLEGSVRRSGTRLRVTVQLIDVRNGYHLWSNTFDREMESVFEIQDEIAGAVVEKLKGSLGSADRALVSRRGTSDLEAYHAYLKGRYSWNRRTEQGLKGSVRHFEGAIDRDPTYGQAWAGLADSWALLGIAEYGMEPPRTAMPRARQAALEALKIDPESAEAQTTLAHVTYAYDWRWEEADAAFRRAIEMDPTYAFSHHWYALFLSAMERHDEAIEQELKARELEPLSLIINKNVGTILHYAGRLDEAVEVYRRALELEPTFTRTHYYYGLALEARGDLEEAVEELRIAVDSDPTNTVLRASLGHALGTAGRVPEAEAILLGMESLAREGRYVPALNRAMVFLGMRRHDEAMTWLEKAWEERSSWLVSARVDPTFDCLRDDPRFRELLDRIGLPSS